MRYSTLLASSAVALLSGSVTAAPSHEQQITFLSDHVAQEVDSLLKNAGGLAQGVKGKVGNVVDKGSKWLDAHLNDPRFRVTTHAALPGYQLRVNTVNPTICDSTVKQISGYLDVSNDKHLFFWFFESRSNPKKDPLTLWLNGGPGCSSTTGLLFELGPCLISKNGTDTVHNPSSWNEASNMIFLDQPVNVGYSYTEGGNVVTTPDAAKDFYAFTQLFLKTFPEYSSNDFNIAGESYAGTYIPNFGRAIFDANTKAFAEPTAASSVVHTPVNLKSLLIGNGLTDPYYQFASVPEYACAPSKHAFLDESQCTTLKNKVGTCQRLEKYCYDSPSRFTCVPAALYCWGMYSPLQATGKNLYDIRKTCNRDEDKDGPLCYKELGWIESYLNRPDIKDALGAPAELNFASCNMDINRQFLMTGDSQHNSAMLLPDMLAAGVRVLIYAGVEDAMCNYIGNKEWFLALDNVYADEIRNATARDLKVKGKVAGKILSAGKGAGGYTFVEVAEAGHMVPTDQPEAALQMFSRWIANKAL